MLLYDVTYPESHDIDFCVTADQLPANPPNGTYATNVNWDGHGLVFCGGEWRDSGHECGNCRVE